MIDGNVSTGTQALWVVTRAGISVSLKSSVPLSNLTRAAAEGASAEICLVELGGTVGDIESMPFLEAVRQLHREDGHSNVMFVHTTLVPVMGAVGEQKTKPTQHSVKELQGLGIRPDLIVGRSEQLLEPDIAAKIAFFADIPPEHVISSLR